MAEKNLIVVALGGNAISRPDEEGNVAQQFDNSRITAKALADLVEQGNSLVITHGNGPQIGNFLLRNEAAAGAHLPLPMEVAVAHVQGGMGFMIAQAANQRASFARQQPDRGFDHHDCSGRGRRSVVLQPDQARRTGDDQGAGGPLCPRRRLERPRNVAPQVPPRGGLANPQANHGDRPDPPLRRGGRTLVVCGGGGVPVVSNGCGNLHGTQAVIDKDLASALLAAELDARTMMILTNVDRICINYGKPDQRTVERMTVAEARKRLAEGQFPPGSMGPKVEGAVNFLEASLRPDAEVIIGPLHRAADAVARRTGTRIVK